MRIFNLSNSHLQATIETNLNVFLALDNSTSMQGSVKEVRQNVDLLVNTLRDKSRIAVVLFDESTGITSALPQK